MSIYEEQLWRCLKEKANQEDAGLPESRKCAETYLAGIRTVCDFAVDRAKTIRDIFPMYTLHDETHICNVMQKMAQLLGEEGMKKLSRDEAAMLILAACCHDLGMSCSKDQKLELENDPVRLEQYCDNHPSAYVKMKMQKDGDPLPDDLVRDFLRTYHHERILDILTEKDWPAALKGRVRRTDLVEICKSHGKDVQHILDLKPTAAVDIRMCAIMLRLADILDFDSSRAPQAVYDYSGFHAHGQDRSAAYSKEEWEKHMSSHGFGFELVEDRAYPYELPYGATCPNMQIEQAVNTYLNWVDRELADCLNMLSYCAEKWRSLVLPRKVRREIEPTDYVSGQFRFTLDQNKVLELLVGDNLYQDPGVFVRELVQNAIDAVRTRREMDPHLPAKWKPQINIRCWMDEEGYHWFRIEDNGIGMNREIVEKYFLKVGSSYYASDDFRRDKYRNEVDSGYQPISRFGIGILSCFMGERERSRVEVSTLHYEPGSDPLRMSLPGLTGYYYLATRDQCPHAQEMKGKLPQEQKAYRSAPGTSIAVRTNLYRGGSYRSFREILDRYVVFPEVPIHYEDEQESYDYPTEQELMAAMHAVAPSEDPLKDGVLEFSLTQEQIREVETKLPGVKILESPKLVMKCVCLDRSKFLSGAVLLSKVEGGKASCRMQHGEETVESDVGFSIKWDRDVLCLETTLSFPDAFHRRMQLLREQVDSESLIFRAAMEREQDERNKEILNGLWRGCDREKEWREQLQDRWGCSAGEIQNRILSVEKTYHLVRSEDKRTLDAYQKCLKEYSLHLFDLGTFGWYRSFWREPQFRVGRNTSVAAHNGVRCSDARFLTKTQYGNRIQAILLLKDGYRPELDVSRTKLNRLPLAADLELAMLRREWELEGFSVSKEDLGETEYWRIPGSRYLEVMDEYPDLKERFRIKTDRGVVSLQEIPALLRRFPEIKIRERPMLFGSEADVLCEYGILACLRRDHILVGRGDSLWLRAATGDRSRDWEEFPPSFFLPVEGVNGKLAESFASGRYYCNEAHPLSGFLIRNRAWLENHTPGLLQEIMESLAEDVGFRLIPRVNRCLKHLREYPGDNPQVPKGAFLTEADFW